MIIYGRPLIYILINSLESGQIILLKGVQNLNIKTLIVCVEVLQLQKTNLK
jgi:hypothetical protein